MPHARLALPLLGLLALAGGPALGQQEKAKDAKGNPTVVMETSEGNITVELYPDKAPKTVDNFLKYADAGFFDGTVFHRVIPGFMIQGGGIAKEGMKEKDTRPPVKNESGNGLSNTRGTLAMARKPDPDSATAQFFINLGDNSRLDNYAGGYTVFGKVTEGMDVVDKIAKVETGTSALELQVAPGVFKKLPSEDVPTRVIEIKSMKRQGGK